MSKKNEYFFQIKIDSEQYNYAKNLVEYSIKNHPVKDIFANDPGGRRRQKEFRMTGSLGEIIFADAYELQRPTRSFGAIDGQDYGEDFQLNTGDGLKSFDIKTMGRKNNNFRENYVLNLPRYQMLKSEKTEYYFCISIHNINIASFVGYIDKEKVMNGETGILYKEGAKRIKDDGSYFNFMRDTYEVDFIDIISPPITDKIKNMPGFQMKKMLQPYKKTKLNY